MTNSKIFHIQMVIGLIVLAFLVLKILIWHYWLLLFVWLSLPLVTLWLAGDIVRPRLSFELHKIARDVLVGATVVLTIINLVNINNLRLDFGKRFIDGYQITISHDCETDVGEYSIAADGAQLGTCRIEDLSGVAWHWRLFLRLSEYVYFILAFAIFAVTLLGGNSVVNKKSQEEWHQKHQSDSNDG